jgi:hypothetical protein
MQTPKIKETPITWSYTCNMMQTPKIKETPSPDLTHATGSKHPRLKKTHHLILHMQQDAYTQD